MVTGLTQYTKEPEPIAPLPETAGRRELTEAQKAFERREASKEGYRLPELTPPAYLKNLYPDMPDLTLNDVATLAQIDPDVFLQDLITKGRTKETESMLKDLGATDQSIDEIYTERVIVPKQMVVEVEGIRKLANIDPETGDAYDLNGNKVGSYNPITRQITTRPAESKVKDIWDTARLAFGELGFRTKQYFVNALPNLLFRNMTPLERKIQGDEWADVSDARNKALRDTFRQTYAKNEQEHQDWLNKHPELQSRPEWQGNPLDIIQNHPEVARDWGYWANQLAGGLPGMLALLGGIIGSTATANPLPLIAVITALTPSQIQETNELLLANGATEDQAAYLGTAVGVVSNALLFLPVGRVLQGLRPAAFNLFKKTVTEETAKLVVRNILKQGIKQFTETEAMFLVFGEAQNAIQNAAIKIFNPEQEILAGWADVAISSGLQGLPLAIFGAAGKMIRVSKEEAVRISTEQKTREGWVQDPQTKEWMKPTKEAVKPPEIVKPPEAVKVPELKPKVETYISQQIAGMKVEEIESLRTDLATKKEKQVTLERQYGKGFADDVIIGLDKKIAEMRGAVLPKVVTPAPEVLPEETKAILQKKTPLTNQEIEDFTGRMEMFEGKTYRASDFTDKEMTAIVQSRLKAEAKLPTPEAGMPEAGLQPAMLPEVAAREVRPRGKGEIVQISMEDQLKLEQARRTAEIEGLQETLTNHPARDLIGIIKRAGKMKGELPDLTIQQYKDLTGKSTVMPAILSPDGKHIKWELALDELASERGYADGESLREGILEARGIQDRIAGLQSGAITPAEYIMPEVAEEEVTPPPPPQSITPPPIPVKPKPTGGDITRIITQSQEQVRQDKTGAIIPMLRRIPGVRQLLEFEQPGIKMAGENQKVLEAMVAENAARSDVSVWAMGTRMKLLRDIREVFGKDSLKGEKTNARFIGTAEQAKNPITSTLKDIADNPELYKLSSEQQRVLGDIETRNDQLLDYVVTGYNAEIGRFQAKEGGAFLPNVDISEDVLEYLGSEIRAVTLGRGKTRVWQTARERMAHDKSFKPETDVQKLLEGLDNFKASAAGGQTYRVAIGGLTRLEAMEKTHPALFNKMVGLKKQLQSLQGSAKRLGFKLDAAVNKFLNSPVEGTDMADLREDLDVEITRGKRAGMNIAAIQDEIDNFKSQISELRPAWEAANLKPYVFIQEGLFRYFPAEQAKLIRESRRVSSNPALNFVERWRGQAFSGDFSPFAIQGVIGVLADPWGSLKSAAGATRTAMQTHDWLRSLKIEALADDIANNPNEWSQFASLMGRGLTGTPREYAAGFLSKIPGFDRFTETTYLTVTRGSFNLWQRTYKNMMKHGIPELEAKVAAADLAGKVYPLVSAVRLGQSQARHAFLRALPTSYSFIRQPASLLAQAVNGLGKIMLRQTLTPQESLAVKTVIIGGVTTMAVSATSAAITAAAKGGDDDDILKAVWDAINPDPHNGKFLSIIIGNTRIPIGGPYRAIFRAVYPQKVEGSPIPLPFVGLGMYLKNRISPAIGTQIDILLNRDYSKQQIIKGDFPENVLRFLAYEFENFLPLTAGAGVEAIRQGEKYKENIFQQMIGQFMGVNPVTLDNTYLDRQIRQLGLPKDTEAKPYSVQKPDLYNSKDLWSDANWTKDLTIEDMKKQDFDPKIIAIAEGREIKKQLDLLPNEFLFKINVDPAKGDTFFQYVEQWYERQRITDPKKLEEFDKKYPNANLGNMSQNEYVLLQKYHNLTSPQEQKEFLDTHPELTANKRTDWLKSHPKENALLALHGQARILTLEAYNQFLGLVKSLDYPEDGLPPMTLPPEGSVENYFEREKAVQEYGANSAEAMLILAKDPELLKWLKLNAPEQPIRYYELQAKNRAEREYYETLSDKDSPDTFIEDLKERKAKFLEKFPKSEYFDDEKRIEAIANKFADDWIESWVERGRQSDEFGGNSPQVKLWAFENMDAYRHALKEKLISDKGGLPTPEERGLYVQWSYEAINLRVKNTTEYEYWESLGDKEKPGTYIEDIKDRWKAFDKEFPNSELRLDLERIEAFEKFFTKDEAELWAKRGEITFEYGAASAEVKVWLADHPDLYQKAVKAGMLEPASDKWNIPALRITAQWRDKDTEYDAIDPDAKNPETGILLRTEFLRQPENDDYRIARRQRDFYSLEIPEEIVITQTEYTTEEWRNELANDMIEDRNIHQSALDNFAKGQKPRAGWTLEHEKDIVTQFDEIINTLQGKETIGYDIIEFLRNAKQSHIDTLEWLKTHPEDASWMGDESWNQLWLNRYNLVINFLEKGVEGRTIPVTDELRDKYVAYYELSDKGYVKERYLLNNPDLELIFLNAEIMGSNVHDKIDASKIPDKRYDDIYFEFQDLFEEYEGYSDGASKFYVANETVRQAKREGLLLRNPDFQQALWERKAYLMFIGKEEFVPDYVGYYAYTRANPKPARATYWFDDDWYLMEHPEFYKAMTDLYRQTDGKEGWKPGERDFSKVPPKAVYEMYLVYDVLIGSEDMSRSAARLQYRRNHPELDAWLYLIGAVSKTIEEYDLEAGLTTEEEIGMELAEKRSEIDKLKEEIERKLKAMK